ncbi:MAG TPA: hypothetical protein EYQ42_12395 [Thiotrichaceae bacterium]|nr:hypothetical protein [Thiotrichaceae bacterium]HIM09146.1 hypothetical protein [Gammaproteobacteria bacterium]
MNGINSVRLDINTARHGSAAPRKRVNSVEDLKSVIESEKKKQFKTQMNNEFDSRKILAKSRTDLLLSDQKYYRANLLGEIVNKMSGAENRTSPGHYVEYYA